MPGHVHHRVVGHRFLEIASVILPVQERRPIGGEHKFEILDRRDFVLVDLVSIQIDLPLRKLRLICVPIHLLVAAHDEPAGRNADHFIMSRQLRTLSRNLFPLWGPLAGHVRDIQRAGNPGKSNQRKDDTCRRVGPAAADERDDRDVTHVERDGEREGDHDVHRQPAAPQQLMAFADPSRTVLMQQR